MAEEKTLPQEEEKTAGEANQQETMPVSDQKPADETLEEADTADEANKGELPESVSERTRQQFEKLKRHNQELSAKLAQKETQPVESVFDNFHPKQVADSYENLNTNQVQNIVNQFVDQDGNVDINGLNNALTNANLQAQQAVGEARKAREEIARYEENRQTKEAYAKYPQLDPLSKDKFDRDFYNLVRDRMVSNFTKGIKKTFRQVSDDIAKIYHPTNPSKIKEEAVADYKQKQQARRQGPLEPGKGQAPTDQATLDELRKETRRRGGINNPALDERLKNLGIIS